METSDFECVAAWVRKRLCFSPAAVRYRWGVVPAPKSRQFGDAQRRRRRFEID
jgi:hypothetical protein